MKQPERYEAKDAIAVLRKAKRLAVKHGRADLAGELDGLLSDVRTAAEQVNRARFLWEREIRGAEHVRDEAEHLRRIAERELQVVQARNAALGVALGDRDAFARLFETGFHIETIPAEMQKPARKRHRVRRY